MVCINGMATMIHRTTFALDETTAQRLKRLAKLWNVSQAEVVRRSVERSEQTAQADKRDPVALLQALHARGGGISKAEADRWVAETYADRKHWRASS
jgi:predicted transcriptional regulator